MENNKRSVLSKWDGMKKTEFGFTLVELMVALAIFSSAVTLVLFGLEQGRQQWQKTTARMETQGSLFNRERWITTMLEQANASFFSTSYAEAAPWFQGNDDGFSFITNAPILGGPGTYAAVKLYMQRKEQHYQLYYTEAPGKDPYYGLEVALAAPGIILQDNINRFSLRYLAPANIEQIDWAPASDGVAQRSSPQWLNRFNSISEASMPIMVHLHLELAGEPPLDWYFPVNRYSYSADPQGLIDAN